MTIGDVSPKKERRSGRKKITFDENVPLLPKSHGGDSGYGHLDEFNGASFMGSVFNLSTTIVGAGIMALPATMKVLGLGLGIAMIVLMAFLTEKSIEFLLRFSRAGKVGSYGGLMGNAFGKYGKILLQICVLINNIGVLIVYMIIIGMVSFFAVCRILFCSVQFWGCSRLYSVVFLAVYFLEFSCHMIFFLLFM